MMVSKEKTRSIRPANAHNPKRPCSTPIWKGLHQTQLTKFQRVKSNLELSAEGDLGWQGRSWLQLEGQCGVQGESWVQGPWSLSSETYCLAITRKEGEGWVRGPPSVLQQKKGDPSRGRHFSLPLLWRHLLGVRGPSFAIHEKSCYPKSS